jgi:hypothetical protein
MGWESADDLFENLKKELDVLKAENVRLREGLRKLAYHDKAADDREGLPYCHELQNAMELLK